MAETSPSHCIKINVSYRETLASASDKIGRRVFILNGNFSNKINQFLMPLSPSKGKWPPPWERYKTELGILSDSHHGDFTVAGIRWSSSKTKKGRFSYIDARIVRSRIRVSNNSSIM